MNERIKQLFKKAGGKSSARNLASNPVQVVETHELWDDRIEKFAELIVRECANVAADRDALDIYEEIREHFGVEESKGWVCPKCGTDRTKEACPQGYMAAVEGKCPMILEAQ